MSKSSVVRFVISQMRFQVDRILEFILTNGTLEILLKQEKLKTYSGDLNTGLGHNSNGKNVAS